MKARIINNTDFGGIYSIEFLDANQNNHINGSLVYDWVLTDNIPHGLKKPLWNGNNWFEGLSIVQIKESEDSIIQKKEFELYKKRKYDGENAYLKLSAEFRLAKQSGQITEETHAYLEELLTPVRNEVMFGQWKKGLSILESVGVAQIGVDLYARLHAQISNYIIENY